MADKLDSTTLDLKPPVPRKKIGAFELQAILGQGGMGIVYRAVGRDGGPAAVKVLRTSLASPELVRRFEREAMIRIEHPNIIQVLDAGIDAEGTPYIAFELAVGETVETRIRRGSLSAAEAVTLGAQVCRGLAAAHAAGVIHRDLKPANLITLPDGTVKLLDFGIALLDTNETRMTNIGSVLGTPSYLSPEQASGNAEVDARTDIWSLGALLYEALSGRGPFDRETALATIVAVIMEEPIPLATRNPRVPPGLAAVIERALQKPRDRRFPSAAAFEAALLGADLTVAPPPTSADALHETQALMAPGENRVVAILLADGVVNLAGLRQAVEGRGGVLLPVIGGRAVGLFGGERWEGDELLRAAAAALEARGQTARMAVASGRAVRTGAALSGAVLKAAEAGCAAGLAGVAADPDTARRLKEAYSVVESRPGIWELQSARAAPRSVLTLSDGTAPPTLGREAELAQMQRALLTVEEGRALALLAVGPAGIGKSRLRMEMEKLLEAQAPPSHLLAARAEPYQRQVALGLFGAALKARARLGELVKGWPRLDASAPAAERQDAVFRLAREVIPNEASARGCAEFLGELVGVAMPETVALRAARSEPRLMADRLQVALQDYFAAAADRGPVALLLEDLQWADPASLDFLDDLLDRLRDVPVLVFATARPELAEARPDLFAGREVVKMEPRGLSGSDVATLARAIVGRPLPDALTRAVAERTAGNPLFVEQIVLELRDRELATTDLEDLPLPLTVEAAVQSRLDHLPAPEKELCKRAAVFGRPFVAEEVEALGVAGAAALLVSLGRRDLVGARARSRTGRAREYQFRSMLVADVAYRMLPDEVRAELHRQAAAYLGRQAEADLEEVASHHERGDQKELAAERYGAAALQAARRGDTQTVLRCVARALELGAPAEVRFPLHMARGDAYRFLGRRDEQAAELAAALAAARTAAALVASSAAARARTTRRWRSPGSGTAPPWSTPAASPRRAPSSTTPPRWRPPRRPPPAPSPPSGARSSRRRSATSASSAPPSAPRSSSTPRPATSAAPPAPSATSPTSTTGSAPTATPSGRCAPRSTVAAASATASWKATRS